jgi:ATP-binding cassette subfamily B protein
MAVGTNRIKEAVARIDNILYQNELTSDEDKLPSSYDVAFENVSFSYNGKTNAVEKVSFKARPGSINAIVGHSGGGKSTLMELLLRFYDVDEGAIKIGGVNIKDISQENLMNLISYVFQDSFLFNDTIENNIRMGNQRATKADVVMAAKAAGIHEVIENLPDAYDSVVGENNVYLSGGEKQRIAIARLFLKDSPIVVLDEATAYADAENEMKIQAVFARLAKNKTVFIIAHRLKTIENADNILVIHEGRLAAEGKHSELMEKCQIYKDMVAANERRDSWSI